MMDAACGCLPGGGLMGLVELGSGGSDAIDSDGMDFGSASDGWTDDVGGLGGLIDEADVGGVKPHRGGLAGLAALDETVLVGGAPEAPAEGEVGFISDALDIIDKGIKYGKKAARAASKPSRRRAARARRDADDARRRVADLEAQKARAERMAAMERRRRDQADRARQAEDARKDIQRMRSEQAMIARRRAQLAKKTKRRLLLAGGVATLAGVVYAAKRKVDAIEARAAA